MNFTRCELGGMGLLGALSGLSISIPWVIQLKAKNSIHAVYYAVLNNQTDPLSALRAIHSHAIETIEINNNAWLMASLLFGTSLLAGLLIKRVHRISLQQQGLPLDPGQLCRPLAYHVITVNFIIVFGVILMNLTANSLSPPSLENRSH